jgi:hypothetical protein
MLKNRCERKGVAAWRRVAAALQHQAVKEAGYFQHDPTDGCLIDIKLDTVENLYFETQPNFGAQADRERQMRSSGNFLVFGATAIAAVVGLAPLSAAQAPPQIDELINNEGIFFDAKSGKTAKAQAKNEGWIQAAKQKAIEIGQGAVIFRSGDKLYLIEGNPDAPIQTMKSFQDNWNVSYVKALKDFQDNWATSYFKDNAANAKAGKDFQDKWNVSYMKAMKDFQDNWAVSYMKEQNALYMKNQNALYMKDQNALYMKNQNASYMKNQNATYMKDQQDNWAISYMKGLQDFQDKWNVSYMKNQNASYLNNQNASYMKAMKDFQDNWANSYMKEQNALYMKNQNASYMNALKDFQDNWATSYMK